MSFKSSKICAIIFKGVMSLGYIEFMENCIASALMCSICAKIL